jgi:hypothetical protein
LPAVFAIPVMHAPRMGALQEPLCYVALMPRRTKSSTVRVRAVLKPVHLP